MYNKPDSQYSQLVMAALKAETETPSSSVSEARAKSSVVGTAPTLLVKVTRYDPPYEALTQQIAYFMSAVTNQNLGKNNGCNGSKSNNGNGKYSSTKFQKPKGKYKRYKVLGCGGTGHSLRECSTPRQGNNLPYKPTKKPKPE